MRIVELRNEEKQEILLQHEIWVESFHKNGTQANFHAEDLTELNLRGANLREANLRDSCLRFVDLSGADLSYADLSNADLMGANLANANLKHTNLNCANLNGAELRYSKLYGANLYRADLPESTFVINGEQYFISITNGDCITACHYTYLIEEWRNISQQDLLKMDGHNAVKFYPRLLDIIDFYCGKGDRPAWLKHC